MRTATNHQGYQIEKLTRYGWCSTIGSPYKDRAAADDALAAFKAAAPLTEWRVMPALEPHT